MSCAVEGCTAEATTSVALPPLTGFDRSTFRPVAVDACDEHAEALMSGEPYTQSADGTIRLDAR